MSTFCLCFCVYVIGHQNMACFWATSMKTSLQQDLISSNIFGPMGHQALRINLLGLLPDRNYSVHEYTLSCILYCSIGSIQYSYICIFFLSLDSVFFMKLQFRNRKYAMAKYISEVHICEVFHIDTSYTRIQRIQSAHNLSCKNFSLRKYYSTRL